MESTITCQQCEGTGSYTRMDYPAIGRASNGETVYSTRRVPYNYRCPHCTWGKVRATGPDTPAPDTITAGGYTVTAPGFTADQFDRAIQRAYADGLRVETTDMPDHFTVTNPGNGATYGATRQACTCKAGQAGTPCKHRAALIMELDIIGIPATAAAA